VGALAHKGRNRFAVFLLCSLLEIVTLVKTLHLLQYHIERELVQADQTKLPSPLHVECGDRSFNPWH
jgi:hypothetical protein